jgi:hypothetical protein
MAADLRHARSVEEAQGIVANVRHVRIIGAGHSFNDIADGEGIQLSLERIPRLAAFRDLVLSFDPHGKFRNAYLERLLFEAG